MNWKRIRIATFSVAILLLMTTGASSAAEADSPSSDFANSYSIMNYNIQQLPRIADPRPAVKDRNARAAEQVIRDEGSDVVVLNEAFSVEAAKLAERLRDVWKYQTPLVGLSCTDDGQWTSMEGNCSRSLIVTSGGVRLLSKYPITEQHQLVYVNSNSKTWDYKANKGAALVRIEKDGGSFWVAATHLQADENDLEATRKTRSAQLAELKEFIGKHAENEPVTVSGDLNIPYRADLEKKYSDTEYKEAQRTLGAALDTAKKPPYTYDATINETVRKGYPSTHESLDYIGGMTGARFAPEKVSGTHILGYPEGSAPSDHQPLVATVRY
ncbi:sphingomyelin phosphodiesterase [Sciscionella sediminilitoris]|uniref:sphingomyelin phosphodiesterase n=1 Tax=Sciscionella sediminilitoris TaxID=1445613 RepID=UPI0004DF19E3|nr:sphingomyelin phosphodiesterase [Sciscionella sp. SE31]